MDKEETWENTKEGRMSIYYLAIALVDSMHDEVYITNAEAKYGSAAAVITFLRELIITEWIGD